MNKDSLIYKFVLESNKIENIVREPTEEEIKTTEDFLMLDIVRIGDLEHFVKIYQPDAALRTKAWMNVQVGEHVAPPGGQQIEEELRKILKRVGADEHPYLIHQAYETLHPFMDGNGRSGRMLWAWQMEDLGIWPKLNLGFLHAFYYQALHFHRQPRGGWKKPRD